MTAAGPLRIRSALSCLSEERLNDLEVRSDVADSSDVGGSSLVGSNVGSHSVVSSRLEGSKLSAQTFPVSAFTAPPRYRNSGAFVHGTKFKNFRSIMEQGLKAAKSDIFMIDEVRIDGRVPGLREPPEILIFIDENKARSENMEFKYNASEGTWSTSGFNGVIRPWFFQKVVDQRKGPHRGNVLFQSKEDPMMQANVIKRAVQPRFLIHATHWENVQGIMREGIVPAKNPLSSLRRPFKDLLQGAESHVYTVAADGLGLDGQPVLSARPIATDVAMTRRFSEPHRVPEDSAMMQHKVPKEVVGLEKEPDAYFIIDTAKAKELGVALNMTQSADREEMVMVHGGVPPELLTRVEPNDPLILPADLKAKIVDPHSFSEIPVLNLQADDATLVVQMRYACEVVGFMQIVGHGVSEELQAKHMKFQQDFFALDEHVKACLALNDENPVRGYFGRGGEDLEQVLQNQVDASAGQKVKQQRKDKKEAFDTNGVPWARPKGGYVANVFGMRERYPDELPGFKEVLEEYGAEMFRLAKIIMRIMARVLNLPDDFFDQHLTAPVATHRLLHYWPLTDFNTEIGVGEHTDYGLLTILKQDMVGGLQVLNAKDNLWIHCCPIENAFVVNLGDMMGRWTAGRFKSTIHRVVPTSGGDRYSVPYFLEPNMDTLIVNGALCQVADDHIPKGSDARGRVFTSTTTEHDSNGAATAEEILKRFYLASGQLKVRSFTERPWDHSHVQK